MYRLTEYWYLEMCKELFQNNHFWNVFAGPMVDCGITKIEKRRISSCSSAGQFSDDQLCFANIPLIPAFLLCTLVIILVVFMVDDVLNCFMWLNDRLTRPNKDSVVSFIKS